jgi:hypothetical protein
VVIDWEAEDRRWRRHAIKSQILLTVLAVAVATIVVLTLIRR